ncbi:MAG: prepilin-type N-terminal cleavage/methylation domain-containing protein [Rhodoferax sp.]
MSTHHGVCRPPHQTGFTLVELLVALALMALMATLSWRGLDGMVGANERLTAHADDVLTLQTGLAQWGADLDALALQPNTPGMDWDGRALRLLRRDSQSGAQGLHVVAWSQRLMGSTSYWLRWQSPPLRTRAELQAAWSQAARWAQNPSDEDRRLEVRIAPLVNWQIFFYRGGAWTNPLSSADTPTVAAAPAPVASSVTGGGFLGGIATNSTAPGAAAPGAMPDGVRLRLTLPAGQAVSGVLTRDWSNPALGTAP